MNNFVYVLHTSELMKLYNKLSEDTLLQELAEVQGKTWLSHKGNKDELIKRILKVLLLKKAERISEKMKKVL